MQYFNEILSIFPLFMNMQATMERTNRKNHARNKMRWMFALLLLTLFIPLLSFLRSPLRFMMALDTQRTLSVVIILKATSQLPQHGSFHNHFYFKKSFLQCNQSDMHELVWTFFFSSSSSSNAPFCANIWCKSLHW